MSEVLNGVKYTLLLTLDGLRDFLSLHPLLLQ